MDEVTDYEEDAAPVMTDSIAADMAASGIPLPAQLNQQDRTPLLARFIEAMTNLFNFHAHTNTETIMDTNKEKSKEQDLLKKSPETTTLKTEEIDLQPTAEQQAEERIATMEQAHKVAMADKEKELAEKDKEIAALQAQLAEMKMAPGDSTSHVVEDEKKKTEEKDNTEAQEYCDTFNRAKALFDAIG